MNLKTLFEHLLKRQHLSSLDMQMVIKACMQGQLTDVQIGVFLSLMRMKGETVEELTAAASVMMELAHCVDLGPDVVDMVGTGGDGKNTFNISTASSIVAAAAGVPMAKHGNYSVSSQSGSADLLIEAGFKLELNDKQLKQCLLEHNACFLFAPHFHQAMQHARTARQQMGIRSLFNLLGPLINPAKVKKQVVGVFDSHWQMPLAQVLANLGSTRALVISSNDGLDEASIADNTKVIEYQQGDFKQWVIDPADYGLKHDTLEGVIVDSPQKSLALIYDVLNGHQGPARDIVLMNAGLAIYCFDNRLNLSDAIIKAALAIDNRSALNLFERLRDFTRTHSIS